MRVGIVFLALVAFLSVLVELPGVVAERGRAAASNASLSFADREVAGGNEVVPDQSVLYEARARIPTNATYRVAVGPDYRGGTALTVPYVASFFTYFLMPRRPAEDAEWIICLDCELRAEHAGVEVVWRGPEEMSILRRRP